MPSSANIHVFEFSTKELDDLYRVLDPKKADQALWQAVTRTTKRGTAIAAAAVKEKQNIPDRYIASQTHRRAAIKYKIERGANPTGTIYIRNVAIPLSAFPHTSSRQDGVVVELSKDEEPLRLKHAFVAKVASRKQKEQDVSHLAILTRRKVDAGRTLSYFQSGSDSMYRAASRGQITPDGYSWRLPVREYFGPSVLAYVSRTEIQSAVLGKIGNERRKQLDSQVSRFTGGRHATLASAVAAVDMPTLFDNAPTNDDLNA